MLQNLEIIGTSCDKSVKYRKFNINVNIPFESFLSKKFSSLQSAYMLGVSMNWSSLSNINLWEKKMY